MFSVTSTSIEVEIDAHLVRDVAQVVAEAAADRQREQLAAIEAEAHAAGPALGAIDDHRMSAGPAGGGFRAGNVSQLDRRCCHEKTCRAKFERQSSPNRQYVSRKVEAFGAEVRLGAHF